MKSILRILLVCVAVAIGQGAMPLSAQRVVSASKPRDSKKTQPKIDNELKNLCFNPLGFINTARHDATLASVRQALQSRGIDYTYKYDRTANFGIPSAAGVSVLGVSPQRCRIELGLKNLRTRYYFVFRSEKEAIDFENRLGARLGGMMGGLRAKNVAKMPVYRTGKWQNLNVTLTLSRPVKVKPKGEKKYKAWTVTLTTDLPARTRRTHTTTLSHLRPMSGSLFGIEGLSLRQPFAEIADSVAANLIPARITADRITTLGTADGLDIILPVPGVAWCAGLKSTDEALYDTRAWTMYEMQFDPIIAGNPEGKNVDKLTDYSHLSEELYTRLIGEIRAAPGMHPVKSDTKMLKKLKIDKKIYKSTKKVWMVPNGAVTDYYLLRRPQGHYTITILSVRNK